MSAQLLSRGAWRLEMNVEMTQAGPLHVGTGQSLSLQTDSPILRDHAHQPVLPGSSIRGVLRHWAKREMKVLGISEDIFNRLFGTTSQANPDGDKQGRLTVTGARIKPASVDSEIRDHIRLNEKYGTVETGAKFDQEVALLDTLSFSLIYEGDGPNDPELLILDSLKNALEANLFSFGGKSSIGLGTASKVRVNTKVCDRSSVDGLKQYLKERLAKPGAEPSGRQDEDGHQFSWGQMTRPTDSESLFSKNATKEPLPLNWLCLDLKLQCEGPTLIAGPYHGDKGAFHQIRGIADNAWLSRPDGTAYLSGSAFRGVLRSQARRILKSLQSDMILAEHLFGVINGDKGQKGMLSVGEGQITETCGLFMNHVAIDRVSGFASDTALFNAAALASPEFTTRLRLFWEPDCPEKAAAVALLFFVLRDLEAGLLWVGSKTTAGYGHIKTCTLQQASWSLVQEHNGIYQRQNKAAFTPDSLQALATDHELRNIWSHWKEKAGLSA